MIVLFKYCTNVKNCESFKDRLYIYIYIQICKFYIHIITIPLFGDSHSLANPWYPSNLTVLYHKNQKLITNKPQKSPEPPQIQIKLMAPPLAPSLLGPLALRHTNPKTPQKLPQNLTFPTLTPTLDLFFKPTANLDQNLVTITYNKLGNVNP